MTKLGLIEYALNNFIVNQQRILAEAEVASNFQPLLSLVRWASFYVIAMNNSFGGAHLSKFGLHFGHFYGSIFPYINNLTDNYFFIIRDRGTIFQSNLNQYQVDLSNMASQVYSMNKCFSLNIRVIRQSVLVKHFQSIIDEFQMNSTLKQLINYHPLSDKIKEGEGNMQMSDFLFMYDTAATFFVLNISNVFLTGNDYNIIQFSRKLIKATNSKYRLNLPLPSLMKNRGDFLMGYNYKKMGIQNNNCIYLSDGSQELFRKVVKLFDFKYLFSIDPTFKASYLLNNKHYIYPKSFLPLYYISKFHKETEIIESEKLYDSTNRKKLFDILYTLLNEIILNVKSNQEEGTNLSGTLNRIKLDEMIAEDYINSHLSSVPFIDTVYE